MQPEQLHQTGGRSTGFPYIASNSSVLHFEMINLAISFDIDDLDIDGAFVPDDLRFFVNHFPDSFGFVGPHFGLAVGGSIPSFSCAALITWFVMYVIPCGLWTRAQSLPARPIF